MTDRQRDHDRSRCLAQGIPEPDEPDYSIVGALVNPIGPAPERETVTLLNALPTEVNLDGWAIADKLKRKHRLSGRLAAQPRARSRCRLPCNSATTAASLRCWTARVLRSTVSPTRRRKPGARDGRWLLIAFSAGRARPVSGRAELARPANQFARRHLSNPHVRRRVDGRQLGLGGAPLGQHAAVDLEVLAGDEAGLVRGQEERRPGDVGRPALAADGDGRRCAAASRRPAVAPSSRRRSCPGGWR